MPGRLAGKIALITGASRGLGAAVAERFAGEGAHLVLTGRTGGGLEAMVRIYAGEIARTRLRVNLIDPGAVRTRLRARIFPGENPANLPSPETIADAFLPLVVEECGRHGEVVAAADLLH